MASLPVSQWMEWMEWMAIRGPIGPARFDYYMAELAMHAGGPYANKVTLADFLVPWLKNPGMPLDEFIRPWVTPPSE